MIAMTAEVEQFNPFVEYSAVHRQLHGGDQYEFTFRNGYGASVVRSQFSYGGRDGLWELAVLDSDGRLTYATPVTDDVIGRLSEQDVARYLYQIASL
jgi:hypothetical protein